MSTLALGVSNHPKGGAASHINEAKENSSGASYESSEEKMVPREEAVKETASGVTKVSNADPVTLVIGALGFIGGILLVLAGITPAGPGSKDDACAAKSIEDPGCDTNSVTVINIVSKGTSDPSKEYIEDPKKEVQNVNPELQSTNNFQKIVPPQGPPRHH